MKYLAFIVLLVSCHMHHADQPLQHDTLRNETTAFATTRPDNIDVDINPSDTDKINKAMDKLLQLPQVHMIDSSIKRATNGKHGAAFMVQNGFNGDNSYYRIAVGDNSGNDHYATLYVFALHKQTGFVKGYNITEDSLVSMEEWQKQNP